MLWKLALALAAAVGAYLLPPLQKYWLWVLVLGVVEVGFALLDQQVVTKLTREGSNLISRDVTLQDAATAVKTMRTAPVDFDNGSRLIFSVVKKDNQALAWFFPRLIYRGGGNPQASGKNQDVMLPLQGQASYDSTTGAHLIMARFEYHPG